MWIKCPKCGSQNYYTDHVDGYRQCKDCGFIEYDPNLIAFEVDEKTLINWREADDYIDEC